MNAITRYDPLYLLASENAEAALFGTSAPLARKAFQRSLAGAAMPIIWFELPLSGSPRFDLHVAHANNDLHREAPFAPDAADGHGALLNWYAAEPRMGAGLALAYDVGDGRIDNPAVHMNVKDADTFDADGFFAHVARPDATAVFDNFIARLPQGWRVWYFGVHPGRPGAPVRVDCFVDHGLKRAYAAEPAKLEEDLRKAGFAAMGEHALRIGSEIAASPFGLELQFDVLADGKPGPTVGLSAVFPVGPANKVRSQWAPGGGAARLMEFAECMGMADSRWRHVGETLFTTAIQGGAETLALYCVPVFAKFRVRAGKPLDAKVYLQAGAKHL